MAGRTQIVCLCEGRNGRSIDGVFINRLLKSLDPSWVRPHGSNFVRIESCGSRNDVIEKLPSELRRCIDAGATTTLLVWADCDHDFGDPDSLKSKFWSRAQQGGIDKADFDRVVFIFAKDRLENWVQFLNTGSTDESIEGPRVRDGREASDAAKRLAELCNTGKPVTSMPMSLQWSCKNWRQLVDRMT